MGSSLKQMTSSLSIKGANAEWPKRGPEGDDKSPKKGKSLLLPRYVLAELQAQKLTTEERPFEPGLEG